MRGASLACGLLGVAGDGDTFDVDHWVNMVKLFSRGTNVFREVRGWGVGSGSDLATQESDCVTSGSTGSQTGTDT